MNKQKKYFEEKGEAVQKMIWDMEFKRFKTLEIREDVRGEYDATKAKLVAVEGQIKQQKETPTMEDGEVKRLDDQKVLLERDIARYEAQMQALDLEVSGSPRTNEYPDGVEGLDQQLEALRELQGMVKEYIKSL